MMNGTKNYQNNTHSDQSNNASRDFDHLNLSMNTKLTSIFKLTVHKGMAFVAQADLTICWGEHRNEHNREENVLG